MPSEKIQPDANKPEETATHNRDHQKSPTSTERDPNKNNSDTATTAHSHPVPRDTATNGCWVEVTVLSNYEVNTLPLLFCSDEDFHLYYEAMRELHPKRRRHLCEIEGIGEDARAFKAAKDYSSCVKELQKACRQRHLVFALDDFQTTAAHEHLIWSCIHLSSLSLAEGDLQNCLRLAECALEEIKNVKFQLIRSSNFSSTLSVTAAAPTFDRPVTLSRKVLNQLEFSLHSLWTNYYARRGKWNAALQHSQISLRKWKQLRDSSLPTSSASAAATGGATADEMEGGGEGGGDNNGPHSKFDVVTSLLETRVATAGACVGSREPVENSMKLMTECASRFVDAEKLPGRVDAVQGTPNTYSVRLVRETAASATESSSVEDIVEFVLCLSTPFEFFDSPWSLECTVAYCSTCTLGAVHGLMRNYEESLTCLQRCCELERLLGPPVNSLPINSHWAEKVTALLVRARSQSSSNLIPKYQMKTDFTRYRESLAASNLVKAHLLAERAAKQREVKRKMLHEQLRADGLLEELTPEEIEERCQVEASTQEKKMEERYRNNAVLADWSKLVKTFQHKSLSAQRTGGGGGVTKSTVANDQFALTAPPGSKPATASVSPTRRPPTSTSTTADKPYMRTDITHMPTPLEATRAELTSSQQKRNKATSSSSDLKEGRSKEAKKEPKFDPRRLRSCTPTAEPSVTGKALDQKPAPSSGLLGKENGGLPPRAATAEPTVTAQPDDLSKKKKKQTSGEGHNHNQQQQKKAEIHAEEPQPQQKGGPPTTAISNVTGDKLRYSGAAAKKLVGNNQHMENFVVPSSSSSPSAAAAHTADGTTKGMPSSSSSSLPELRPHPGHSQKRTVSTSSSPHHRHNNQYPSPHRLLLSEREEQILDSALEEWAEIEGTTTTPAKRSKLLSEPLAPINSPSTKSETKGDNGTRVEEATYNNNDTNDPPQEHPSENNTPERKRQTGSAEEEEQEKTIFELEQERLEQRKKWLAENCVERLQSSIEKASQRQREMEEALERFNQFQQEDAAEAEERAERKKREEEEKEKRRLKREEKLRKQKEAAEKKSKTRQKFKKTIEKTKESIRTEKLKKEAEKADEGAKLVAKMRRGTVLQKVAVEVADDQGENNDHLQTFFFHSYKEKPTVHEGVSYRGKPKTTTDEKTGTVSAVKCYNLVPNVENLLEKQKVLRAMLPSLDHRSEIYRLVVKELSENETILQSRRDEVKRRKLEKNAERIAKKAGIYSAWNELVTKREEMKKREQLVDFGEVEMGDGDNDDDDAEGEGHSPLDFSSKSVSKSKGATDEENCAAVLAATGLTLLFGPASQ